VDLWRIISVKQGIKADMQTLPPKEPQIPGLQSQADRKQVF
jgi:hypothetical protein